MQTRVVVTFSVEGFHNWPGVVGALPDNPEIHFLQHPHRHLFAFKLTKSVSHNDRDIEIILFKRKVLAYLYEKYGTPCQFGMRSCEMLGMELVEKFHLSSAEVLEDGENGAIVEA